MSLVTQANACRKCDHARRDASAHGAEQGAENCPPPKLPSTNGPVRRGLMQLTNEIRKPTNELSIQHNGTLPAALLGRGREFFLKRAATDS